MEITILTLVAITFVAGVVGGLVIADGMDTHENGRRQRRAKRQARRDRQRQEMRNIYVDFHGKI